VSWDGTEGGAILPDRPAAVSRGQSTTQAGGKARTVERSRGLGWRGAMASGEGSGETRPLGGTRGGHARSRRSSWGVSITLTESAEPPET
jgi:hypothetical protein